MIQTAIRDYAHEMTQVRLPRWDELPGIELYSDQMIHYLRSVLKFLDDPSGERAVITATMVNNYVKKKLIPKPTNKRYDRVSIAHIIVISILKNVFSMEEIAHGITLQLEIKNLKSSYDAFVVEFERSMGAIFGQLDQNPACPAVAIDDLDPRTATLSYASLAVASKLLIKKLLQEEGFYDRKESQ